MKLTVLVFSSLISLCVFAAIVKLFRSNTNNIRVNKQGWCLIFMFLLSNILDVHSTWLFIQRHGIVIEGNPIIRYFFKEYGILGIIFINRVPGALLLIYISLLRNSILLPLIIPTFIFSGICINNYIIALL